MSSLPQPFMERVVRDMGQQQADALFAALETQSPTSIRVNPYKMKQAPTWGEKIGWSKYGLYLQQRPSFTLDSDFHAGAYYVQEASSQFVGHILAKRDIEGLRVLDMCAAPGGKTTLYSTAVGLEGLVVANEINRSRANVLADNVRKWGLGNVVVCNNRSEHVAQIESWFDVVAIDTPCSGEGMFRKGDIARSEWSADNVVMCAERSSEILENAWRTLKEGGTLIYSTCTFNRDENEAVLEQFLQQREDEVEPYEEVECDPSWGIVKGQVGAFQTFRFFPHAVKGEGLFIAVATKSGSGARVREPRSRKKIFSTLDKNSVKELSRWVAQPEQMVFLCVADSTIYGYYRAQAKAIENIAESLTSIYSGVAMGQIFKGKLKPDPALALFHDLAPDAVRGVELDNVDILSYLRRQDNIAPEQFDQGINVVRANGYAVGFVKRIGNRINNLYPNSLRILK